MRKVIAIIALVVSVAIIAPSHASDLGTIPGTYVVTGVVPDGTKYTLEARILAEDKQTARIDYYIEGDLVAVGIGIRTGNVLSVIFQTSNGAIGLSSYKVEKNTLTGTWVLPGFKGHGIEVFTRSAGLRIPAKPPKQLEKA